MRARARHVSLFYCKLPKDHYNKLNKAYRPNAHLLDILMQHTLLNKYIRCI